MIYGIFKSNKGHIFHGTNLNVISHVKITPQGPHITGIDKQCFTLIIIVYQQDNTLKTFVLQNGIEYTFDGISILKEMFKTIPKGSELSLALAYAANLFTDQKKSSWTILRLFKKPFNVKTY